MRRNKIYFGLYSYNNNLNMDIYCFIFFMFYGCIVGNIVLFYYVGVVFMLDIYVRYVYFCKLFILKVIFLIFVMDII